MNRSVVVIVLIAFLMAAGAAYGQTFVTRNERSPVFISASSLFTDQHEFRQSVPSAWRDQIRHNAAFEAAARARLRSMRVAAQSSTSEPCGGLSLAEADIESPVRRDSRESTIVNAKAIFVGTIDRIVPGMFYASPASVLRLVDLTAVKAEPAYRNVDDELFVRHPYANFRAGQHEYCRAIHGYVPAVGDRVMVFAFEDPAVGDGILVSSFEHDLIIETAAGQRHVPRRLEFFAGDGSLAKIAAGISETVARQKAAAIETIP